MLTRRVVSRLTIAAVVVVTALAPAAAQQGWEPVVAAADAAEPATLPRMTPSSKRPAPLAQPPAAETAVQLAKPAIAGFAAELVRARAPAEIPARETSAADQYCVNIANAAADAKFAWQKKTLEETERQLEERIALLETKTAEYEKWVTRRDDFMKKARDGLILIYSRMRPDAAAAQLMAMDEESAAAVLLKLDPRVASAMLGEMEPAQAARLTATIIGSTKSVPGTKRSASPADPKS